MKAAQIMSKNLNADVVVVQTKKKPFSFKNPLPSTAGINKSLKKAKTSLTQLTNAAVVVRVERHQVRREGLNLVLGSCNGDRHDRRSAP